MAQQQVSELDNMYFERLRADVAQLIKKAGQAYDNEGVLVLDIAPQDHEGAAPHFSKSNVETLDIDSEASATYIADICQNNADTIPGDRFDVIVCTEVLEHTLQPFDAVNEIERMLKPGGVAVISVPYNFRIHGPLPDCWRFTEHGLRVLFKNFEIIELTSLDDENRFLAPIHYNLLARKHA